MIRKWEAGRPVVLENIHQSLGVEWSPAQEEWEDHDSWTGGNECWYSIRGKRVTKHFQNWPSVPQSAIHFISAEAEDDKRGFPDPLKQGQVEVDHDNQGNEKKYQWRKLQKEVRRLQHWNDVSNVDKTTLIYTSAKSRLGNLPLIVRIPDGKICWLWLSLILLVANRNSRKIKKVLNRNLIKVLKQIKKYIYIRN